MLRLIRWTATCLVAVLALAWGVVWMAESDPNGRAAALVQGVLNETGPRQPDVGTGLGGPFNLIDSTGQPVSDLTYRGKWMLVYFGYTYCPDICPTTLQTIGNVLDQLGDKAVQITPIFITVDPERDTPAAIGQYTALFDQRIVGLTGTSVQVDAAQAAFRVYSRRINSPNGSGYVVDHSSYIYLVGPDGKVKVVLQGGLAEADMVTAITVALSQRG